MTLKSKKISNLNAQIAQKEFIVILQKLKQMVQDQLDINVDKVTPETNIKQDLGLDSLDIVEILMSVEEEWGIVIDDSETASIETVGDVIALIEKKTK